MTTLVGFASFPSFYPLHNNSALEGQSASASVPQPLEQRLTHGECTARYLCEQVPDSVVICLPQ